ncbi:hypothetical protein PFICI_00246 [Pestalotiopsis fici W106-1]|uniref:F-box domain-containing protein n=1 Tax=Pestalotiopsis fici (strain W106-1 / CGMCC3.15140) TaxID=1229662 RepID=W3XK48_PESFW|nr:uncharacterized protein PFICI_00246 [Pestalotiopsis fici W106-1]ETS86418.1 hypothetical protein PFICI_00246 [Pestalotiopsis fici W106-1]
MDLSLLPAELVLNLVKHMDMATLLSFMITNKSNHSLVRSYEHSICKAKVEGISALTTKRNFLSSSDVYREVCAPDTFPWVCELELRERRIADIISSGYIDITSPPGLQPLTTVQQKRFIALLERSLRHCDAIADVAASMPDALPEYDYTLVSSGFWGHMARLPASMRTRNPFTNTPARSAQIEYIKSLPVEDLAALYVTITAAGAGHVQDRPDVQADPSFSERLTVFEECVLRHGTWFFWAQVSAQAKRKKWTNTTSIAVDDDPQVERKLASRNLTLREMTGYMLIAGMSELIEWETGAEDVPPGLRMSLLDAAEDRFEDDEGRPPVYHLYKLVRKLVFEGKE